MAKRHVYHWKHGWIPLDHTAALSKAKGDHKAAAKMLEDAGSHGAGIHSREHVAKSAVGLSHISNPEHRAAALADVHAAADRHKAHDVLPKALQKPHTHPVGSKVDARQPGIDMVTSGEVVGHDEHGMVRVKYQDHRGNDAVGTFNPSHVTPSSTLEKRSPATPKADRSLEHRMAKADAAMSADAPLTASEQADMDAAFAAAAARKAAKAAPKAAPTGRAKGIVLPGRTDANRYDYRDHAGELQPQTDAMVRRLKRLEATWRKAEREGKMVEANRAHKEFASITGERVSAPSYQPGVLREAALPGTDANPHVKTSISASEAKVGDSVILPSGGRMNVAKIEPAPGGMLKITDTNGRGVTVSPRQAMSRFDGASSPEPPKAAPKTTAPKLHPAGSWQTHARPDGGVDIVNAKGVTLGSITRQGDGYVGKMNGQHGSLKHADPQHILDSFYNELNGKDAAQKARGDVALSPAEQKREAFRAAMRQHVKGN